MNLSRDDLIHALDYDPETGVFRWRHGQRRAGRIAGVTDTSGYRRIGVRGRLFIAHRLAWFYMTGTWPAHALDHINGERDDNRWVNLREATWAENNQHKLKFTRIAKSGYTGVYPRGRRWGAQITVRRKSLWLGLYDTAEEANAAYRAAKATHHPFSIVA